jgi:hypothetical protein
MDRKTHKQIDALATKIGQLLGREAWIEYGPAGCNKLKVDGKRVGPSTTRNRLYDWMEAYHDGMEAIIANRNLPLFPTAAIQAQPSVPYLTG